MSGGIQSSKTKQGNLHCNAQVVSRPGRMVGLERPSMSNSGIKEESIFAPLNGCAKPRTWKTIPMCLGAV